VRGRLKREREKTEGTERGREVREVGDKKQQRERESK
jgi:hypothetical protein